jgi:aspartyl aminopeptidase
MMKYTPSDFNKGLCQFLDASPTPYHAVASLRALLDDEGFVQLYEADSWGVLKAGKYYVIRQASIIAFTLSGDDLSHTGIRMVGAHTDSPCLKVKPKPEKVQQSLFQLGVEVYGGALLNPWFDRDLSLAGRVSYENQQGQIEQIIIDFKAPIATIPSLAIHLDREANQSRSINSQLHLPPILSQMEDGDSLDFRALLEQQCRQQHPDINIGRVLDYEMCFYDTQKAAVIGLSSDFITSARLDNLLSCYVGLQSLLASENNRPALLVCNDHEEVGSQSISGAQGTFLQAVLQRLVDGNEAYQRMVEQSMFISADNAHAIHPNYADKHDAEHGPLLNKGPVIKTNANQRYATSSQTSAIFRQLCEQNNVPVQDFVVRTDMACGSTIGPITSSHIGVKTIDIGLPTFAMHSIRELAGSQDAVMLHKVLTAYFNQK